MDALLQHISGARDVAGCGRIELLWLDRGWLGLGSVVDL